MSLINENKSEGNSMRCPAASLSHSAIKFYQESRDMSMQEFHQSYKNSMIIEHTNECTFTL